MDACIKWMITMLVFFRMMSWRSVSCVEDKDFCSACGVKAVRRASEMPSLTSNVLYAMKMPYKYAQSAHSDKNSLNYIIIIVYNDVINTIAALSPNRDLSH